MNTNQTPPLSPLSPSIPHQIPKIMKQNQTESKPSPAEQPADEGLDVTIYSPSSSTPETAALRDLYENHEHRATVGDIWELCESLERERNAALADKMRLDWLLENHAANFECVENIAGNLERYHIPATRDAIDEEISRMNANVDLPDTSVQDSASKSNNPAVSG